MDRLIFKKASLKNGIELYSQAANVGFFYLIICIPVGTSHSHNENGGLPGIAHFLEHLTFERSKLYPERNSFERAVLANGGSINASTSPFYTTYYVQAPTSDFAWILEGFMSQIFEPVFTDDSIAIQKGIIRNERRRRRYYPGRDEISSYLFKDWMHTQYFTLEQIFGSDDDLSLMTPDKLEAFHAKYRTGGIKAMIGGDYDLPLLSDQLGKIELGKAPLVDRHEAVSWTRQDFHSSTFKDIESPIYFYGSLFPFFDLKEQWGVVFILNYLTLHSRGPLSIWLRNEKGWTYGLSYRTETDRDRMVYRMSFPVNGLDHIDEIRKELSDRMIQAIGDEAAIADEVERRHKERIFFYQTVAERVDQASNEIFDLGHPITETDYREMTEICRDTGYLKRLYDTYLSPEVSGEFLALSEEKK